MSCMMTSQLKNQKTICIRDENWKTKKIVIIVIIITIIIINLTQTCVLPAMMQMSRYTAKEGKMIVISNCKTMRRTFKHTPYQILWTDLVNKSKQALGKFNIKPSTFTNHTHGQFDRGPAQKHVASGARHSGNAFPLKTMGTLIINLVHGHYNANHSSGFINLPPAHYSKLPHINVFVYGEESHNEVD
jgi:hypothetical protein